MNNKDMCWNCGKPATRALRINSTNIGASGYNGDVEFKANRHFCDECYQKHSDDILKTEMLYGKLKKKLMFERAIRTLETQQINLYEFKDVIVQMQEYVVENPKKFDSSHEMIVAIMLVANGIKSSMQYKIGTYMVDFYIPSLKMVLEVDGHLHKYHTYYDNERDIKIRSLLGKEWEVVRIPTKYIEANAKQIVPAAISIKAEKQKIREEHNGIIPEWYSNRNSASKKTGRYERVLVDE